MDIGGQAQAAESSILSEPRVMNRRALSQHGGQKFAMRFWLLAALALAIPTVLALAIQLSTYPNHDVAWVLWGAREMMHGAEYGRDIIEPNPPLAWYLSMPTNAVAMALGVPLDWSFRVAVTIFGGLAAGTFAVLLGSGSRLRLFVFAVVAGGAVLVLPGREFGQREHLAVIAALPYLALTTRRVGGNVTGESVAVVIGVVAGLGFALKPYFLAIPALVELTALLLAKPNLRVFRSENIAISAVLAAYMIAIIAFGQDYLRLSVPLANEIYWSFNLPWSQISNQLTVRLLFVAPLAGYFILRRDVVGMLLTAACVGFVISYVVQHKGYLYHLLPISILTLLMLTNLALVTTGTMRIAAALVALVFLTSQARVTDAWWQDNRPDGARTTQVNRFISSIDEHARGGRFLIVAVHPYPTFPVAIYVSAQQVSRTNSHWFLPAVVEIRSGLHKDRNAVAIEDHAREFMLRDLAQRPDLVMIDTDSARHTNAPHDFDFLAFYQEDPKFRAAWRHYREIEHLDTFRQFIRVDAVGGHQ